jgi:PTH1 family peptidyl-tRNA hydrolase
MHYIVGLGNPGDKYTNTRHNVGWTALGYFLTEERLPNPVDSAQFCGSISQGVVLAEEIAVLFPNTFMNKSGSAVRKLVPKEEVGDLVVVYDDVDLPVGEIKVSVGRGAGGHNGVASIIDALGSKDFVRVRVGIAPVSFWTGKPRRPEAAALSRHVLGKFTRREETKLAEVKETVRQAIKTIITDGVEVAMNKFN